jgi:hypothetical protein
MTFTGDISDSDLLGVFERAQALSNYVFPLSKFGEGVRG